LLVKYLFNFLEKRLVDSSIKGKFVLIYSDIS